MSSLQVFFIGMMVGVICVGGLALGVRWLFKAKDETLSEGQQQKYTALGLFMMIGQFVGAGLILFITPGLSEKPLPLAGGLLSMNLLLPLLFGRLFYKNKRRTQVEDLKPPETDD